MGLVPLSGDEHDVPGLRLRDGTPDRHAAIQLHAVTDPVWYAGEHVVDDRARFFAARIIAGQIEPIGELRGSTGQPCISMASMEALPQTPQLEVV